MYEQGSRGADAPWSPASRTGRTVALPLLLRPSRSLFVLSPRFLHERPRRHRIRAVGAVARHGGQWVPLGPASTRRKEEAGRRRSRLHQHDPSCTHHDTSRSRHTQNTSTLTPPLCALHSSSCGGEWVLQPQGSKSLGRFLGVSDASTCTATAKPPASRSLQGVVRQQQQTHQKTHKITKNQVKPTRR